MDVKPSPEGTPKPAEVRTPATGGLGHAPGTGGLGALTPALPLQDLTAEALIRKARARPSGALSGPRSAASP
ncbi:MAG: hypothetical protein ABSE73_17330, partial [Planctomycetota bacterium]